MTLGLLAAMYPGSKLDKCVTFSTLGLISVPEFLVATFLAILELARLAAGVHYQPAGGHNGYDTLVFGVRAWPRS